MVRADSSEVMRRLVPLPLLFALATVFGISSTVQAYVLSLVAESSQPEMIGHLLALNLVYWYVPALVAPVIMAMAVRIQPGRASWPVLISAHVMGALAYAAVHTAAMLGTGAVLMPKAPARGWWHSAQIEFLTQLDWMLMTYLFLVGLALALAYRRESETRALDAAHLETRLVEAQLQALQRQLHPHFLFNTLNTIAGLMRTDVNSADRMIDRLAELLRATLRSSSVQEVTLRDELDLLQKYVDIEQTRFGARLSIHMHVESDTLDARVPVLLLQPLVENAVRHGIAPHARPGTITVDARRVDERLRLSVLDTGDGVAPERLALLNHGVGLANTRARLQHLYRDRHQFAFSNTESGFRVSISIPFAVERHLAPESIEMGAA